MKKIILVSLVAVMLTSFTACTKKEEPKDEITFKTYIEDTLPEETTTEATETEAPEETTAPEATEEIPDSSSVSTIKKETYSFKIDETKWFGVMDYLEATNDEYIDAKKGIPDVGKKVTIKGKEGKVISSDPLQGKYRVLIDNEVIEVDKNDSKK